MPRVLQVAEATIGGVRRHLRELSLGLADLGWQVDIAYALGRDPGFARDLELFKAQGLGLHELAMKRRPALCSDLAAMRRLQTIIDDMRPDIIHAHSSKAGVIARLAARKSKIPVCYTPHSFAFEMQVAGVLRWGYRQVERRLIRWTAGLIAVSQTEEHAALALGYAPSQVAYIPNGIPALKGKLPPDSERQYDVTFIGRFCRQKGADLMLELMERLQARRPELHLAAMGSGSARIEHSLKALPNVTLLPFSEAEAVQKLLLNSRIIVMPSRWEGMPYLLLEAMAAGTAVAATDVGGVTDVVQDRREALVIPPENVPALEQALTRLLDDDTLRQQLTAAARQRVESCSLKSMIATTDHCYQKHL